MEGLRREGWFPFFAVQSVPRDGSRHGHAKHMMRLRRDDGIGKPEAAEVIIVNSHDGTSAFQLFAGMLRFVCTNSMIAGERFEEVRVPHKGNIQHDIIEGVYTVAEDFPRLIDASEGMKATQLSEDERRLLGEVSLVARYGDEESPVRPEQIIEPRRREDVGNSLWSTFNVIQENVIRGGLHGRKRNAEGRIRRSQTRAINGIDQNVTLNRALWTLAEGCSVSRRVDPPPPQGRASGPAALPCSDCITPPTRHRDRRRASGPKVRPTAGGRARRAFARLAFHRMPDCDVA